MGGAELIERMMEEECRKRFGMPKAKICRIARQMEALYYMAHRKGGRPMTLDICARLAAMLEYYHGICSIEELAGKYGVSASTLCKGIHWAEAAFLQICEAEHEKRGNRTVRLKRHIL